MVSCWHDEPGMRPSFKELTCHWERMLEDGVEYLDLNPRTVHNQAYFASLHALDSPTSEFFSQNYNFFSFFFSKISEKKFFYDVYESF